MNLTGLSTGDRVVIELLLDSLIPAPILPQAGSLLDVGSGAGFPAIPLKIHSPKLKVDLVEAKAKKVSFLRQVIRLLGIEGIRVIRGRVEEAHLRLQKGGYHLVTARAVTGLGRTVTWCAPFLRPTGLLVSFLGADAEKELEENREVLERWKLRVHQEIVYLLPGKDTERHTLVLKKEA